jgi:nitroimidazol reductase NimA-like FMN-containing flavoprotein (pyridoxamine 5'-phosphate oxidase superfamily)
MRVNPLVCVEVDEVRGHDDWVSIIVLGRYLEIPNTPEYAKAREEIRSALQKRSLWWQSGYTASQIRRRGKPVVPVFYIIQVEKMSGLRSSPDTRESGGSRSKADQYNPV